MIFNSGNGAIAEKMGMEWWWEEFTVSHGRDAGKVVRYKKAGKEAERIIAMYHNQVKGVKELAKGCKKTAEERGYIYTYTGRRLRFPNGAHSYAASGKLIQATSADRNKENWSIIEDVLGNDGHLILNTHDSYSMSMPEDNWQDFEVWKMANPNFGVSVNEDYLHRKFTETMNNASKQNINLCKHLNMWMKAGVAWMNMVKWEVCADQSLKLEDFIGRPCYAALDLASKIDICALILLFKHQKMIDGELVEGLVAFGKYYLPEDTTTLAGNEHYDKWVKEGLIVETPGAMTDFLYIENDLKEIHANHPIEELAFDPREAGYLVQNVMQWLGVDNCIEIAQGPALMSEPMKETEGMIYDNRLWHSGDPVLTWMMGNVIQKKGRNTGPVKYYYPTKEKNESKIDGAVSLIMAMSRAMLNKDVSAYSGLTREQIMAEIAF